MKVGVLGNVKKIKNAEILTDLLKFLTKLGYETVKFSTPLEINGVDVVLVLGGDGAILHSAIPSARKGIKIIGINFGNLGFLTEYEKNELEQVKELLFALEKGCCRIVKRSILQFTIQDRSFYALNEIALQRDYGLSSENSTQILKVEVQAREGKDVISGDGVLICTPTGSTAYSLSAGGAILTPEVPVFMITPICAFSMRARPIVFSEQEEFVFRIAKGNSVLIADGTVVATLPEDTEILVKKAEFTADFPVKENSDFFAKVRNKLNG